MDEISPLTIRLLAANERLIDDAVGGGDAPLGKGLLCVVFGAGLSLSSPSGILSSFSLDEQLKRFVVD